MITIPEQDYFSIKEVAGLFNDWFKICRRTFDNNHRKKMNFDLILSSKDKRISKKNLIEYIKTLVKRK